MFSMGENCKIRGNIKNLKMKLYQKQVLLPLRLSSATPFFCYHGLFSCFDFVLFGSVGHWRVFNLIYCELMVQATPENEEIKHQCYFEGISSGKCKAHNSSFVFSTSFTIFSSLVVQHRLF